MSTKSYELVDCTDNDVHDSGSYVDMCREAAVRNAELPHNDQRWSVWPAGRAERLYKG